MDTPGVFSVNVDKGDNIYDFLVAFLYSSSPSEKEATIKGKNFLPWRKCNIRTGKTLIRAVIVYSPDY